MAAAKENKAFGWLLDNRILSDCKIICGTRTWSAHKAILANKSGYFSKAFTMDFKEAKESVVRVTDKDAKVVHAVLQAIYTDDYTSPSNSAAKDLAFHTSVYIAGEFYQAQCARDIALRKLKTIELNEIDLDAFERATQAVASDLPESAGDCLREWMASKVVDDTKADNSLGLIDMVVLTPGHGLAVTIGLADALRETSRQLRSVRNFYCSRCSLKFKYGEDDNWLLEAEHLLCRSCCQRDALRELH